MSNYEEESQKEFQEAQEPQKPQEEQETQEKSQESSQESKPLKEKYAPSADAEGYVPVTAFCHLEFGRQSDSIAGLLDGQGGLEPDYNLGEGIKFKGGFDKPWKAAVHIDSLDDFCERAEEHYAGERKFT